MSTSAVSLLLDPRRLMVAGSLVGTARTTDEVAHHTGLPAHDVVVAVDELCTAGLVVTDGATHLLPWDVLHAVASERADSTATRSPEDRSTLAS